MKKLFIVLLVVAMVFALGACNNKTNPGTTTDTDTSVGMITGTTDTNGTTGTADNNTVTKEGFSVKLASADEAMSYTRVYEVGKLTGDDQLIIFGESNMTNLKVTSGTYDNGTFTDGAVVHEEKLVLPGEAVLLKTSLPENGGNIKVTFTNASGKVMNYVITRNNGKLDAVTV